MFAELKERKQQLIDIDTLTEQDIKIIYAHKTPNEYKSIIRRFTFYNNVWIFWSGLDPTNRRILQSNLGDIPSFFSYVRSYLTMQDVKTYSNNSDNSDYKRWKTNTASWFFSLTDEQQEGLVRRYIQSTDIQPLDDFYTFINKN